MLIKNTSFAGLLLILLLVASTPACDKLIDVDPPTDKLEAGVVFSEDKTAIAAATGLYGKMVLTTTSQNYFGSYPMTLYPGLAADELYATNTNANRDEIYKNAISPTNGLVNDLWRRGYEYIYHTNAVLEGLDGGAGLTDSIVRQLKGEMKFMRAFFYFYLVNLFGEAPLQTTTDYRINQSKPRQPVADLYQFLDAELQEASELLSASYPTAGKFRPNKWAAVTLRARLQLYRNNWASAESLATLVIDAGVYALNADPGNIFQIANNKEPIWQLQPNGVVPNTNEASNFIPSSATARPTLAVSNTLAALYATGDKRKTAWLPSRVNGGTTYYVLSKYKVRSPNTNTTEALTLFRLAELLLIRAEARAHLGKPDGPNSATSDLNLIRTRANASSLSLTDEATALAAIANERRLELIGEWGHRWFDLKRTGQATTVLQPLKGNAWQATDTLFPIPNAERLLNPGLTQNQGYN